MGALLESARDELAAAKPQQSNIFPCSLSRPAPSSLSQAAREPMEEKRPLRRGSPMITISAHS
jgi:hypothetical protein